MKTKKITSFLFTFTMALLLLFTTVPTQAAKEKTQTPLQEYAEEKEDLSYEELTEEFGTPSHVISEYFSEVDEEYLFRQLRIRGYVKKFLIFVVIAFLAFNGYCYYWAYQDYLNAQDQHIMYEEIIIEED